MICEKCETATADSVCRVDWIATEPRYTMFDSINLCAQCRAEMRAPKRNPEHGAFVQVIDYLEGK